MIIVLIVYSKKYGIQNTDNTLPNKRLIKWGRHVIDEL